MGHHYYGTCLSHNSSFLPCLQYSLVIMILLEREENIDIYPEYCSIKYKFKILLGHDWDIEIPGSIVIAVYHHVTVCNNERLCSS